MAADYYTADTQNGDHMNDPSEDGLFMLLGGLNLAGNTVVTITPADEGSSWRALVTFLADGTYKVETSDPARDEYDQCAQTTPSDTARDLTIWLAARDF
jgi:hypothetical protein